MIIKTIAIIITIFLSAFSFGHGGDNGPSSLEQEFSRMSHIHLPVNFNTHSGLILGFSSPGEHDDHFEDHDEAGHDKHDEAGGDLDIHPVVFAGYEKINRFVNLEEAQKDGDLDLTTESDKFLHIQNRKWTLGLGLEIDVHLPLPFWALSFGLSYIKAKNYITSSQLDYRFEKRGKLLFPLSDEISRHWRVGDSLTYMSSGSMVYSVMVGVEPFFHIGPEYIHSGSYQVNVKLENESTLEVEVLTTKTNSIGIEGNAIITGVEASTGHGQMKSIVYDFDLSKDGVYKVLRYIFEGRVDLVNREILKGSGEVVLKTKMINSYRSITGNIGIPILFFRGASRGEYVSSGNREYGEDDFSENVHSTTILSEKFSRGIISRHFWEANRYTTTIIREDNDMNTSIINSQYNWSFSNDNMRWREFKRKFAKIVKKFKLRDLYGFNLPYKKNGFVSVNTILSLNGQDVLFLLNGANLKDLYDLSKSKLYGRTYNNLKKKYNKLKSLRTNIEIAYTSKKYNQLTSLLSEFSKIFLSSPTMVTSYMDVNPELKVEVKIVGEHIRQHHYECNAICTLE